MISIRQFLIIALLIAGLWFLRRLRQRFNAVRQTHRPAPPIEEMVRCTRCGVYIPRPKAIADPQGELICSHCHNPGSH